MKYLVIFLILIGTIGMSSALESKEIKLDEPFMIKLHQRLSVDNLDVEFSGIEDSRCPSDGRVFGRDVPLSHFTLTIKHNIKQ